MSYPYIASAGLGPSKAASTIAATVVDLAGADLVSQPTRAVVNLGGGEFGVSIPDMPDGQTGWVLLKEGTTVLTSLPVSPREVENADVKTGSRGTSNYAGGAVASVTAPVTLTSAYDPAKTAAQATNLDALVTTVGVAGAGLTAVGDTAGTATLLGRLTGTRAGYLDNLSAGAVALHGDVTGLATASALSTLTTTVGVAGAGLTALAPASTALSNATWTNTKAGFIDVAISSVSGGGGTAPTAEEIRQEIDSNSTRLSAIQAKTDNLPTDPADQSLVIAATDGIMARLGSPVGASLSADIQTRSTFAGGAVASVTAPVTVGTITDKTGYALTPAYDPAKTAAQAATALSSATWTDARAGRLDHLDAAVSSVGYGNLTVGAVVAGSTGASVVVSGLPAGKDYAGQHLYHYPSGESRVITSQAYASPNYTFAFAGASGTASRPFDSLTADDAVSLVP